MSKQQLKAAYDSLQVRKPLRLTGNLFLTGSIGSGKSQILLRLLKQVLANFSTRPALLAIDPKRTSDVHIQPDRGGVSIRFRINGELVTWKAIREVHKVPFLQEAKRLSQCDLSVSLRAQDARISLPDMSMDVRVSLIPTIHGEKLVLRIFDYRRTFNLDSMLLGKDATDAIRHALGFGTGVCLITGPTGSGKTTLLYSALDALDRGSLNIVTIEDPVEYAFPGITQVQVSPKIGFSDALRSIMRQDPDVILVGEVRDQETAQLCFQAAATGHLVLSTLHANGAAEVTGRLRGLGLRDDQVTPCLRFASAQRLLGRLCKSCRLPVPEEQQRSLFAEAQGKLWTRNVNGCECCSRGLIGRIPAFEYVEPSGARSPSLGEAMLTLAQQGEVDTHEILSAA